MTRAVARQMSEAKTRAAQRKEDEAPHKHVPQGDRWWRGFKTKCFECGTEREHGRGYIFVGMDPEGEMKTFCNVDCCDKWEKVFDNKNNRRAAIKAQKARKEQT